MNHLEVLRDKIARLRSEIADIHQLNEHYRFRGQKEAEAEAENTTQSETSMSNNQEPDAMPSDIALSFRELEELKKAEAPSEGIGPVSNRADCL